MYRMMLTALVTLCLVGTAWSQSRLPQSTLKRLPQSTMTEQSTLTYDDARKEAVKESKPLVVWVNYKCPSTANQLPGFVHHFAGETWEGVTEPSAIVYVPKGDGFLYRSEYITGDRVCAANLRTSVDQKLGQWERSASVGTASTFKHVRGWASSKDGSCGG